MPWMRFDALSNEYDQYEKKFQCQSAIRQELQE